METLEFKNNDLMPGLGLGTWKSQPNEIYTAVREAISIGYRHIDCAAIYGNEKEIGKALQDAIRAGDTRRSDLWITSKLWNNAHEKDLVIPALKQSLQDLQMDYLDLYLIHWPVSIRPGAMFPRKGTDLVSLEDLPISETWEGMISSVEQGLSKHIGVSNFSEKKLKTLIEASGFPPEMNQIELHPFLQQNAMLDFCRENGIHLTAYSPLGSKDRPAALKQKNEPDLLADPVINQIASDLDCSPAQVLIAWALHRGTAVIPKSVNPARLKENFKASNIKLSPEQMNTIFSLDKHARFVPGNFWTMPGSPYTLENLWDE